MATFAVDAVVLSRKDIGEADRLITLFSRSMGKMRVIAKGARRPTSRMGAHLEPGRESHLFLVERRSLPLVTQAQTLRVFISRQADLAELKDVFGVLEVAANLLEDDQRDSRLYDLLVTTLSHFNRAHAQTRAMLVAAFMLKSLHMLGYSLELAHCMQCDQELVAGSEPALSTRAEFYLSTSRGGILHTACGTRGPNSFLIDTKALLRLRQLLTAKLATIDESEADRSGNEILRPLQAFVEWTSERALKSSSL
ncbi:MAG: DNA repair protein RecO [bacterium]|nr:DNA repair protein RecO [bacterium]